MAGPAIHPPTVRPAGDVRARRQKRPIGPSAEGGPHWLTDVTAPIRRIERDEPPLHFTSGGPTPLTSEKKTHGMIAAPEVRPP